MARWVAYSWLGVAAGAPLSLAIILWFLVIAHTYRRRWRSLDLLLGSLVGSEGVSVAVMGAWAILRLARPETPHACHIMIGFLTSIRVLQLTTLTSLIADRALTLKWPYRYRLAARRTQIRYHLGVLVIVSVLVGIAATFALPPSGEGFSSCSFLPHHLSTKYALLSVSVEGGLVFITLVGIIWVQACLIGARVRVKRVPLRSPSDLAPIGLGQGSSDSSSASSTARRSNPVGLSGSEVEFRWPTVLAVAMCQLGFDFAPHLVVTILGTFLPGTLPDWDLEPICGWGKIGESFLLPLLLLALDPRLKQALQHTFSRRHSKDHLASATRFHGGEDDEDEDVQRGLRGIMTTGKDVKFPLTNGSLFTSGPASSLQSQQRTSAPFYTHNYRRGGWVGALGKKEKMRGVQEVRGIWMPPPPPTWKDPKDDGDLMKFYGLEEEKKRKKKQKEGEAGKSRDSDLESKDELQHVYASLSDSEKCNSLTTDANDDFEFHDTRKGSMSTLAEKTFNSNTKSTSRSRSSESTDSSRELILKVKPSGFGLDNPAFEPDSGKNWSGWWKKTSSLSMNALDSLGIEKGSPPAPRRGAESVTMVLPGIGTGRSESTLSLFRSSCEPPPYMPMSRPGRMFIPVEPSFHQHPKKLLPHHGGGRGVTSLLRKHHQQQQQQQHVAHAAGHVLGRSQSQMVLGGVFPPPRPHWLIQRGNRKTSASVPDVRRIFVSDFL